LIYQSDMVVRGVNNQTESDSQHLNATTVIGKPLLPIEK